MCNTCSLVLHGWPPGGTPCKMGYGYVRPWRPPFHALLAARKTFSAFCQFWRPYFHHRITFFKKTKLKSLKISKEFSSQSYILYRKLVHKGLKSAVVVHSQVPLFGRRAAHLYHGAFFYRLHAYTKMKVECLPRGKATFRHTSLGLCLKDAPVNGSGEWID